jgi:hypothetical protein
MAPMNYFFLKLGSGNEEAEMRLSKNPPEAVVYFDDLDEAAYKSGEGKSQPRLFWERGRPENHASTVMVVIYAGQLWLLQPAGSVHFGAAFDHPDGWRLTPKVMPVRILKKAWCKDVPPVLAGIGSSQHHGRRTFTRIDHWGNRKAIDYVLGRLDTGKFWQDEHWKLPDQKAAQLLECLGSTELETLVGKLFEARGCHVPAYLGGTLKDIDLFAHNDLQEPVTIGEIVIAPKERISIQVKTWGSPACPQGVDYLIGLDAAPCSNSFGAEWLLARVKECPPVLAWMKRSLNWLPKELFQKFGL